MNYPDKIQQMMHRTLVLTLYFSALDKVGIRKILAILRRIRVLVWHGFFCIRNRGVLFGCQRRLDVFLGPFG
jgi:hypothetical protein